MNGGVIFGICLVCLGLWMILSSEGHNVGYLTTIVGGLRIFRSLGK